MAMLAEPRRKQKWTLNPRGKHWSEDSNKFGQRMLEKMGWSAGKGLGANEQGMTEHVRVSFKNDTAGIGFKMDDLDKAWTEYQESFNDLLQELQKCQGSTSDEVVELKSDLTEKKSLEQKSKQSRARVHYQKFTRGKDVNRYSTKDLANIFGQKELTLDNKAKEDTIEEEVYENDPVGTQDNRAGVVTINSGSMTDYFGRIGGIYHSTTENKTDNQSGESDCEITYTGFGFASAQKEKSVETQKPEEAACFENPCLNLDISQEIMTANDSEKVAKKRKKESQLDNDYLNNQVKRLKEDTSANSMNGFVNPALNLETASQEVCNGKEFEVSRAEFGITNTALDLTDEVKDTRRVTFNDHVEYSVDSTKKKKGRATLDKFEVENKKHKRKRKQNTNEVQSASIGFVNEALDVHEVPEEINDNEVNERRSKKSKKRKESRSSTLETIPEAMEEEREVAVEAENDSKNVNCDESSDKKISKEEKKKKKKKKDKSQVENTAENVEVQEEMPVEKDEDKERSSDKVNEETQEENVKEHQKSKKKKKDKQKRLKDNIDSSILNQEIVAPEITNATSDAVDDTPIDRQDRFRISIKKKKKNKKKEREDSTVTENENGVSNTEEIISEEKPNCEPTEETQEPQIEANEESVTKKEKKKKKKKAEVIESEIETGVKETSDKENSKVDKSKRTKKSKKNKEQKEETLEIEDTEQETKTDENSCDPQNTESTPSKKKEEINEVSKFLSSPWNEKAKLSKRLIKSLFHRNAISTFPGSNIQDIKGYGVDV